MPTLYIIRGLPGSGKSTYARKIIKAHESEHLSLDKILDVPLECVRMIKHYEADQFFETATHYNFDSRLLRLAHAWCHANVVRSLRSGYDVIVSNTFTRMQEMAKYLEIHDLVEDVKIEIIEMHTHYGNIHNVPEEKLQQMADRWEEIPEDIDIPVTVIGAFIE